MLLAGMFMFLFENHGGNSRSSSNCNNNKTVAMVAANNKQQTANSSITLVCNYKKKRTKKTENLSQKNCKILVLGGTSFNTKHKCQQRRLMPLHIRSLQLNPTQQWCGRKLKLKTNLYKDSTASQYANL